MSTLLLDTLHTDGMARSLSREAAPLQVEDEFWTSRQRQANRLHEVSYRACFKPQLPRWFIERFTRPGDVVYDPFSGRGTTAIEAALNDRRVIANDINPLSRVFAEPRLQPPELEEIRERLGTIDLNAAADDDDLDLSMFYHPDTERELRALRGDMYRKHRDGTEDHVDRWIRMVATNRLTGHSPGFFSVYTLPPNQATSCARQAEINRRRGQTPPRRDVANIILRKSAQLLADIDTPLRERLWARSRDARLLSSRAQSTPDIANESVALTVTSPPFLDIVNYAQDNWLRCWFNHIDVGKVAAKLSARRRLDDWSGEMLATFHELFRVTRPGGHVAFEVGEVRNGTVRLEDAVQPLATAAGFRVKAVMINRQSFTKTANIWGVRNNDAGTNTNRIVLMEKP